MHRPTTHILRLIGACAALSVFGLASTSAQAGILGSKHDLGIGGGAQQTSGTANQVCVFCHTPHGSDTSAAAPLWNKVLGSPASYTRYSTLGTVTLDGTETEVGSVSLACLSCHDGTQAMDVVVNSPGSGGYNAAGTEIDGASIGLMTGTPIPNLGQDLRDDHPISIQYAGGGCNTTTPACGPLGDPDFATPQNDTINGNLVWWVDTTVGTAGTREKTDMILYTRTEATAANEPEPFVECGSCHDPHADTSTPVSFLRINNDTNGSDVCLACHTK